MPTSVEPQRDWWKTRPLGWQPAASPLAVVALALEVIRVMVVTETEKALVEYLAEMVLVAAVVLVV